MLDLITKHFLVISSVVVGTASVVTMVFLAAYLAVFDWSLIWLIEYSDLTKLILIGIAFMSSIFITWLQQAREIYDGIADKAKKSRWFVWLLALTTVGLTAVAVYVDVKTKNGQEIYHVFRTVSFFIFCFLVYVAFTDFKSWISLEWKTIVSDFTILAISLGIFGATFGYYIKDGNSARHEIWTKDEKFIGAKIVMHLSHHVAFQVGENVIVVPASDVVRLVTLPSPSTAKPTATPPAGTTPAATPSAEIAPKQ